MISLDSKKWNELTHAYGKASDIPNLLRALEDHPPSENYKTEPYYSLWSALCHQGDTYSASIAASPHLVKICQKAPEKVHWSVMQLIVCIEISRLEGCCSEDISDESYRRSVKKSVPICRLICEAQPSKEIELVYRAAVLAASGDWEEANSIFEQDD